MFLCLFVTQEPADLRCLAPQLYRRDGCRHTPTLSPHTIQSILLPHTLHPYGHLSTYLNGYTSHRYHAVSRACGGYARTRCASQSPVAPAIPLSPVTKRTSPAGSCTCCLPGARDPV